MYQHFIWNGSVLIPPLLLNTNKCKMFRPDYYSFVPENRNFFKLEVLYEMKSVDSSQQGEGLEVFPWHSLAASASVELQFPDWKSTMRADPASND
jgi:hypothetical protein